jgi:imidazolonepropionase
MFDADFALFNVDHLVTVAPGCHPAAHGDLGIIDRAALTAKGGVVVWVGLMDELEDTVRLATDATVINTHGRTVLPGFVDPHTHPVFAGNRLGDFYGRALGHQLYSQQLESGGIMSTVEATRKASEDALLDLAFQRADTFLVHGTTTVQAKSGYGLTLEHELKSLRVLNRLQQLHPLKVVPAFLGAHVVPADFSGSPDDFVREIIEDWMPAARDHAEFADVWCDEGAFTVEQCRTLLWRARDLGYSLTAHANELGPAGGARLAAEMGARSVDHAVYLADDEIVALRESGTVAVLLPGTTFFLGHDTFAPARTLIDAGVTVALGTDFNPGTSCTQNMSFILTLAVLKLSMTPEEAIRAATINAARALDLSGRVGTLEPGKYCDFSIFGVRDYREIPYQYAMNTVESVVAGGELVVRDGQIVTPARPAVPAS